eukprot:6897633-Pyramimonas_sp.AAC.1
MLASSVIEIGQQFQCMMCDGGNVVCGAILPDRRAVHAHIIARRGYQSLSSVLGVSNQCCVCLATFASR